MESEIELDKTPLQDGCEYINESLAVFVIGASGDLAKKKTYPSLFALFLHGYLPKHTIICGYARSNISDDELRQHIRPYLNIKDKAGMAQQSVDDFLAMCIYRCGAYDSNEAIGKVATEITGLENTGELRKFAVKNRLFYFAIPPSVFVPIGVALKATSLTERGWNRIIVEKPFGHDSESFEKLSADMDGLFTEEQIYRIDHYLGKEMVQNLMILRFANAIFEPIWNRNYISSVTVTFKEDIGTKGRGGYFDSYGIIRDVMQNHLLQVLSLVAMEPPIRVCGEDYANFVRDEKVKVLKCIETIEPRNCVLGQYVASEDGSEPGYLQDPTVPKDSVSPTFATCILYVNNARWEGVPFIMKAGKALNERKGEIRVQFKDPPGSREMFPGQEISPNELVLRLQPNEAVYMKTNVKSPGLTTSPVTSELDLTYNMRYDAELPDAYTRLILDVLRGKQATFVRDDELKAAWRIFTPLLHHIEKSRVKPIPYKFGSRGPEEADQLLEDVGFRYHRGNYVWRQPSLSNL